MPLIVNNKFYALTPDQLDELIDRVVSKVSGVNFDPVVKLVAAVIDMNSTARTIASTLQTIAEQGAKMSSIAQQEHDVIVQVATNMQVIGDGITKIVPFFDKQFQDQKALIAQLQAQNVALQEKYGMQEAFTQNDQALAALLDSSNKTAQATQALLAVTVDATTGGSAPADTTGGTPATPAPADSGTPATPETPATPVETPATPAGTDISVSETPADPADKSEAASQ